jgi:cytochrome c
VRRLGALLAMVLLAPASASAPRGDAAPPPLLAIVPPPRSTATRAPEFRKCAACHNIEKGAPNGLGPNLYGVFARPAATAQPRYAYSPQLRASGRVWDFATLDRWLAEPRAVVPGTRMTFGGLKNPEERKAVIAFLRRQSASRP